MMKALIASDRAGEPVLDHAFIAEHNTTIYGANDRYRGILGRRDAVFVHPDDLADRGLADGDAVDLAAAFALRIRRTHPQTRRFFTPAMSHMHRLARPLGVEPWREE
jgi:hypothetical protein